MKRIYFLASLLLFACSLSAQKTLITAATIAGGDGNPIQTGRATWLPTDLNGNPLNVNMGSTGGIMVPRAAVCLISNGAITTALNGTPCTVVNTATTNSSNFCYRLTIQDTVTKWTAPVMPCVQPSGTTWSLDTYVPPAAPTSLMTAGPAGPACTTGSGICVMSVPVQLPANPTAALQATPKQYVDSAVSAAVVGVQPAIPNMTVDSQGNMTTPKQFTAGTLAANTANIAGPVTATTTNSAVPGLIRAKMGLQMATSGWSGSHFFGDSISACYGTSGESDPNCWVNQVATATGTLSTESNYASPGDTSCDMANHILDYELPTASDHILRAAMIGVNDAVNMPRNWWSNGLGCLTAALAYLSTDSTLGSTGSSFGTPPTNWTYDTTYAHVTGLKTSTSGAVASFPYTVTTNLQEVFVFYEVIDGETGNFVLTDSAPGGSGPSQYFSYTPVSIATPNSANHSVFVAVLAGNGRTPGTYAITATAGTTGSVHILRVAVASADGINNMVPIFFAGTPRQAARGWVAATQPAVGEINGAITGEYYAREMQVVAMLQDNNLPINSVAVRSYYLSSKSETYDTTHPGPLGHTHIATAFLAPTESVQDAVQPVIGNFDTGSTFISFLSNTTNCPYSMADIDHFVIVTGSGTNCVLTLPANPGMRQRYEIANLSSGTVNTTGPMVTAIQTIQPNEDIVFEYTFAVGLVVVSRSSYAQNLPVITSNVYPPLGLGADTVAIRGRLNSTNYYDLYFGGVTGASGLCWSANVKAYHDANNYAGLAFGAPSAQGAQTCAGETFVNKFTVTGAEVKALVPFSGFGATGYYAAAAGFAGEDLSIVVPVGSAVSMTTSGTTYTIATLALTAGDWMIEGLGTIAGTSVTTTAGANWSCWINNTTAQPSYGPVYAPLPALTTTTTNASMSIPNITIMNGTATQAYLSCQAAFSAGTVKGYGVIHARRAR